MTKRFKSCAVLELPGELAGLIFSKLPFLYMFQLRLVCKHWKSLLFDTAFLEKHVQLTTLPPLFVWQTEEGFAAYNPEINSWQVWPKSFIPVEGSLECDWWNIYGGADGLLYLYGEGNSEDVAHLVNPVTRSHRKLPANPRDFGFEIVGRTFDRKSKTYKIFGGRFGEISFHGLPLPTMLAIYNPELGSWEKIGEWEYESNIGEREYESMFDLDLPTIHQGVVHCLITSEHMVPSQDREAEVRFEKRHRVLRFEGEQSWHQLTAAQIPLDLHFVRMFDWQGSLMLVGGKEDQDGFLLNVQIWQLDEERNIWVETLTMSDGLLHSFARESHLTLNFRCYSSDDYLYLISYTANSDGPELVCLAMCNLSKSSWWEAPELSTFLQPKSRGFLFKPGCIEMR